MPEGACWVHEIELPGARVLAYVEAGPSVRIVHCRPEPPGAASDAAPGAEPETEANAAARDWTEKLTWLAQALAEPGLVGSVIDGVVCAVEPDGRTRATRLPGALAGADAGVEPVLFAFDLPFARGQDLRQASLIERKRALRELLGDRCEAGEAAAGPVRISEHVLGAGAKVFDRACELGVAGVVSKRVDSIYEGRRTPAWIEVECARRMSLVVGGFTAPHGSRRYLGALLLGSYDPDGRLVYRGKVGSGFGEDELARLRPRLDQLRQDQAPFDDPPLGSQARGVTWVRPTLAVEVEYGELTSRGKLRHARFKGLGGPGEGPGEGPVERMETTALAGGEPEPGGAASATSSVGAPVGEAALRAPGTRPSLAVGVREPDKLLVASRGLSKRDLADYAMHVAERMLPHVRGRALELVRCPVGIEASCWTLSPGDLVERGRDGRERPFRAAGAVPEGVRIEALRERAGRRRLDRIAREPEPSSEPAAAGEPRCVSVVDGLGLLGLIELDVLEIRARGARLDKHDCPDRMVFALLGADARELPQVIEAAHELRDRLAELGLISFVKTAGCDDALHVVVPVQRRRSYAAVARFCRRVTERMVAATPQRYSLDLAAHRRQGRIAIDDRLNRREAALLAPYSPVADRRALVSTPLAWAELDERLRPADFDLAAVTARLARSDEDPWEEFFSVRQWITKASFRRVGINPDALRGPDPLRGPEGRDGEPLPRV